MKKEDKIKIDNRILKRFIDKFWFAPCDGYLRAIEAMIWRKIKFVSPVLDIGIGDGRYDSMLFRGRKIDVGIDPDCDSIQRARKVKLFKKVICQSGEKMNFKKSSFNTVISNSTFEHIEDDIRAVSEVSRVLKKGGRFMFSVPLLKFVKELKGLGVKKKEILWFDKRVVHLHYRSLEDWQKILRKNKLKIVDKTYFMPPSGLKVWWKLFKIITYRPYYRELWSYLKDSPYGKYAPKKLLSFFSYFYVKKQYKKSFSKDGVWLFLIAEKQ